MNDQMDYDLYVLAEIAYTKDHNEIEQDDLFPINWYASKNYRLKVEIIGEALERNIMIEETELFKQAQIKGVL